MPGKVKALNWSTNDEINHLRYAGRHRKQSYSSRLALLEGYLSAAEDRTDWGKLNKGRIIQAVKRFIKVEIK